MVNSKNNYPYNQAIERTIITGLQERVLPLVRQDGESPNDLINRLLKDLDSVSEEDTQELAEYGFTLDEIMKLARRCLIKAVNLKTKGTV